MDAAIARPKNQVLIEGRCAFIKIALRQLPR